METELKRRIVDKIRGEWEADIKKGGLAVQSAENSLGLIDAIFSSSSSFILEFIQNAEDAGNRLATIGKLDITINSERIKIVHNGSPFNEENIRAISRIGTSKKPENGTLGYLGVGFKSVFKISNCPEIHSGGFSLKYDENFWKDNENIKSEYWKVIPIWVDAPREPIDQGVTTFIIPFKSGNENYLQIKDEVKNIGAQLYLFLKWLKLITVVDEVTGERNEVANLGEIDGITTLQHNGSKQKFKFFRKEVSVPDYLKDDERVKKFRKNVTKREISIAFEIGDDGDLIPSANGAMCGGIYSFMPLGEANSGSLFPIQADFFVEPSRSAIKHEDRWNHWLMDEVFELCKEAIGVFQQHEKWRYQFLPIFSHVVQQTEGYKKLFYPKLFSKIDAHILNVPVIPTAFGGWAGASTLIRIEDQEETTNQLFDQGVVNKENISIAFSGNTKSEIVHPNVLDGSNELKIRMVSKLGIIANSNFMLAISQREDAKDKFFRLYKWLASDVNYTIYQTHRASKYILCMDGQLRSGTESKFLALDSESPHHDILVKHNDSPDTFLDEGIFSKSTEDEKEDILRFLKKYADITEVNAELICKKKIFPLICVGNTEIIQPNELIKYTKICHELIKDKNFLASQNKRINVLTKKGEIKSSPECLLSSEFAPENNWEKFQKYIPAASHFINPTYLNGDTDPDSLNSWRQFFESCGVKTPDGLVEKFAINYAIEKIPELIPRAINVISTEAHNWGYDLVASDADDTEVAVIEVKGKANDGDVVLTPNESKAVKEKKDHYYLIVVSEIPNNPSMYHLNYDEVQKYASLQISIPTAGWRKYKVPEVAKSPY